MRFGVEEIQRLMQGQECDVTNRYSGGMCWDFTWISSSEICCWSSAIAAMLSASLSLTAITSSLLCRKAKQMLKTLCQQQFYGKMLNVECDCTKCVYFLFMGVWTLQREIPDKWDVMTKNLAASELRYYQNKSLPPFGSGNWPQQEVMDHRKLILLYQGIRSIRLKSRLFFFFCFYNRKN